MLEGDILMHIRASNRPEFYETVLLHAVQMTNKKLKTHRRSAKMRCYTPQTSDTAYSSIKQSSSRTSLSPPLKDIDNYDIQQNIALYLESVENSMNIDPIEVDSIEPSALESKTMANIFNCPLAESIDDQLSTHPQHNAAINCSTEFRKALWAMCKELIKPKSGCVVSANDLKQKRKRSISIGSKESNDTENSVKRTKRQRSMVYQKQAQLERENERLSLTNEWQLQQQKALEVRRESAKVERLRADSEVIRKSNMDLHAANYLFKNVPKDPVCQVCYEEGSLCQCLGTCCGYFHRSCMASSCTEDKVMDRLRSRKKSIAKSRESTGGAGSGGIRDILDNGGSGSGSDGGVTEWNGMCVDCNAKETMNCFICRKDDVDSMKCDEKNCVRCYHEKCLKKVFPQYKVSYINQVKKFTCPRHICHTCISSDVKNMFQKPESDRRLIKCLLCPGTYHRTSKCLPAGSEILSEEQMICGRHHLYKGTRRVNVDFCMLCSSTGELICCDTCPHAFHEACLKIPVDDDQYVCEECESGKRPLYGEVVWVRYSKASWWPGKNFIIYYPEKDKR